MDWRSLFLLLHIGLWPVAATGLESAAAAPFVTAVQEPTPIIDEVFPASIDACSSIAERRIIISGRNFRPESNLLIDGITVPATATEEQIAFTAPQLSDGLHEIRIVSPGGSRSEGRALLVNSDPEIHTVSEGSDWVIAYDVIITGRNLLYTTVLVVDGAPVTSFASEHRPAGESLTYIDCNTMIYHRYPYSRAPKEVTLQVVNPEGREGVVISVTIP